MKQRQHDNPVSVAEQLGPQLIDLGLIDYVEAHKIQLHLVEERRLGRVDRDLFLLVEHPATFTLGRRGGEQNLMVSPDFLRQRNIPVVPIERGGDITFHGPGQLVLYPIVKLKQWQLSVTNYVSLLEETMLALSSMAGVKANRDPRNHGIWVGDCKLGSVGIAIRRGLAFHGLALNVNISLEPFTWVNPCGLSGVSMTSLEYELGYRIDMAVVKKHLLPVLETVFGRKFVTATELPA